MFARRDAVARFRDERGDVAVIARGRLGVQRAGCARSVLARSGGMVGGFRDSTPRCSIARRGAICNASFHSSSSKMNLSGGSASGSSAASKASANCSRYFSMDAASSDGSSAIMSGSTVQIEQRGFAILPQRFAKFPAGIKTARRSIIFAARTQRKPAHARGLRRAAEIPSAAATWRARRDWSNAAYSGSNARMDSMVSPSSSTRTGCGDSGEKISMMPPRTANCPGISQVICLS